MTRRARIVALLLMVCTGIAVSLWYASLRPSEESELKRLTLWQSITVYDARSRDGSANSNLDDVPRAEIPSGPTEMIVENVTYHRGGRLWKGDVLGKVALVDGGTETIAISYYGGFFRIIGRNGYYQTHGQSREQLDATIKKILAEEFIPKRQARNASVYWGRNGVETASDTE